MEQARGRDIIRREYASMAQIGAGFLKCLQDGSLRMPLFFW